MIRDFPAPGLTFRLDPTTLITIPFVVNENSDGRGAASVVLPYVIPTSMGHNPLHVQAVVLDSVAPNGLTITNALEEYIGG